MKKSFMTRALATGLSLAMAFSLTAATNVTSASAAAKKPTMITYAGASAKSLDVKVGETVKIKVNAATKKNYKVSAVKVSSAKITAKFNKAGTVVAITGKTATPEGKQASVKVSFKAKKTGKTSKYSYVSKVSVIEDKQSIVKAEVTGVKTVTLTMTKDVASVASPVAITVKKGAADRACKATAEGKTITLAMDAKLTQGAYTVSITGLEDTALTADFNVEKDETLTSFEVSDNLVAQSVTTTTVGTIKYAALNQYGEKMVANDPTVTCSFGKVGSVGSSSQKPTKSASASAQGVITVWDINAVQAIPGTKGTIVLVGDMGVTTTKEITYNTFAKATKGEVVGTYNINSAELKSLKEGAKLSEYELLMKFTNQYDEVMSAEDLGNTVNVTISGGLTDINLNTKSLGTRTYNGEDYVAVKLDPNNTGSTADAGEATLIVTNDYYGMLINEKITVAKNVVIKSMTFTAENGLYAGQDNDLNYEFVDADGNSVTSYADLVDCGIGFIVSPGGSVRMERAADGKAKFIYDGSALVVPSNPTTDKNSVPVTLSVNANSTKSGDYITKTFTLTGYQARYVKGVTGIKSDVTTAISASNTGKNLTIKNTDIVLADQYSNKVTDDEKIFDKSITNGTIARSSTGTSVYVATNGAFDYAVVDNAKIVATPTGIAGTATVYLKYQVGTKASTPKDVTASADNYDAKFTLTAYDTKGVDVSTLTIDSICDGNDVTTGKAAALAVGDVTVKAVVGGSKTVIPESQYTIVKNENKDFTNEDDLKGVNKKTATLTVQVTTWDKTNTPIETVLTKDYTVSRESSKLFKVTEGIDLSKAVSTNAIMDKDTFKDQFKFKDQYGNGENTATALASVNGIVGTLDTGSVDYTIDMVSAVSGTTKKITGYTITSNGVNAAKIQFTETGVYTFKVTAKAANGSTKTAKFVITVS